jgi:hypothetical protein
VRTFSGRQGASAYEFVVVGAIGPTVRRALEPCSADAGHQQTIVRARATDLDLVELARRLQARGITVAAITVLEETA